jgi:hypothetical protein
MSLYLLFGSLDWSNPGETRLYIIMFNEDDVRRLFKTIQFSFLARQFDAAILSEMSIL